MQTTPIGFDDRSINQSNQIYLVVSTLLQKNSRIISPSRSEHIKYLKPRHQIIPTMTKRINAQSSKNFHGLPHTLYTNVKHQNNEVHLWFASPILCPVSLWATYLPWLFRIPTLAAASGTSRARLESKAQMHHGCLATADVPKRLRSPAPTHIFFFNLQAEPLQTKRNNRFVWWSDAGFRHNTI